MSGNRPYYFVASHKVLDRNTINDVYVPRAIQCLNKYDVEILAVNETTEVVEGQTGHDRLVILKFPSRDEALRWYHSDEYQSMIDLRLNSAEGTLILAEGLSEEDLAAAGVETVAPAPSSSSASPRTRHARAAPAASGACLTDTFRSGEPTTSGFQGWSDDIKQEFQRNKYNGAIGNDFVFENDSVRVWLTRLEPGEKMPAHRHHLTYFCTALAPGRFLQRTHDGATRESGCQEGETHFHDVKGGEFALHDLENVGDTAMTFCAVELKKESANVPLSLFNNRPRFRPGLPESDVSDHVDGFRSGVLESNGFQGWSDEIVEEFKTNEFNGRIGTDLVFENDSVRVWHMTLKPGDRMPVHRHVLTYFWTAVTPGRFLQRTHDGTTYESSYEAGLTHFYNVGAGEFALHNLENAGDATMVFVAVELKKESANASLPV